MNSTTNLEDTTVASLRSPGVGQTNYFTLRCLQTALITQMYAFACADKFESCKETVPYSAYPRKVLGNGL